jgi:hypothetical protein
LQVLVVQLLEAAYELAVQRLRVRELGSVDVGVPGEQLVRTLPGEHDFDLLRGLPGEEQVRDRAADQGWVEVLDDLDCVVERLADGLRAAPDALLFEPL